MKRLRAEQKVAVLFLITSTLTLFGCGKDEESSTNTNAVIAPAPHPIYGVQGANTCIPISQPITFQMNGIYVDSANVIAGRLPYTDSSVGVSRVVGSGYVGGTYFARSWEYGDLSMNIFGGGSTYYNPMYGNVPYSGFPQNAYNNWSGNSYMANAQGTLRISPYMVQRIRSEMRGFTGTPYANGVYGPFQFPNTPYQPNTFAYGGEPCVSHISLNIGKKDYELYGGLVFIYLNNTPTGYVLRFFAPPSLGGF